MPATAENAERAGDVIFFNWKNKGTPYDHVGMVVAGKGTDRAKETYTSHTTGRFIYMAQELGEEIPRYLKIQPSEGARGTHWNWHIMRMVHTSKFEP